MKLSPLSSPFFSSSSFSQTVVRKLFSDEAKCDLSPFEFKLFSSILSSCFSLWKNYVDDISSFSLSSLHVLMLNARGLAVRWQEVLLLISSLTLWGRVSVA